MKIKATHVTCHSILFYVAFVMSLMMQDQAFANNQLPVATWSQYGPSRPGVNIQLVTASWDPDGGSITAYKWFKDGVQKSTASSYTFTENLAVGQTSKVVTIRLEVRDDENSWNSKTSTITITSSGKTDYYLTDHLGSIRTTIDGTTGAVLGYDDYYPFGQVMPGRSSNAGTPNDLNKFTGHERDQEGNLNLDYMLARNYDPEIGRFLSVDPLFSKYPSISPYAYVANNPIIAIDPDGRDIWFVHGTFSNTDAFNRTTQDNFSSLLDDFNQHSFDWEFRSWTNTKWGRKSAAEELADNITAAYKSNPEMLVNLVAHSHGGNVAIEAANILANRGIPVETLFLLGTPSRYDYKLTEENVKKLYNLYKKGILKGDWIQILGGTDVGLFPWLHLSMGLATRERSETEAETVKNIEIEINGEMHSFQNSKQLMDYIEKALKKD